MYCHFRIPIIRCSIRCLISLLLLSVMRLHNPLTHFTLHFIFNYAKVGHTFPFHPLFFTFLNNWSQSGTFIQWKEGVCNSKDYYVMLTKKHSSHNFIRKWSAHEAGTTNCNMHRCDIQSKWPTISPAIPY